MKLSLLAGFLALTAPVLAMACAKHAKAAQTAIQTPSGLSYVDKKVGEGDTPKKGQTVIVDYTGWLLEDGKKGEKFDSSIGRGPFSFTLGEGRVIKGWDEGVATMKVGGKRELTIPAELAYGAEGAGGKIPPNSTLVFEVELLGIK